MVVLGIVAVVAVVGLVLLLRGAVTGAPVVAGGAIVGEGDGVEDGVKVVGDNHNFLAAKLFQVKKKVCVKRPKGAYEWYAVFEGSFDFDPLNLPFFLCESNKDCKLLGKEARCEFVEHILLPERGVVVQSAPAPRPEK